MTPFQIITYGSFLEETPAALYAMDELRRREDERRRGLDPIELAIVDEIERIVEHAIFYGDESVEHLARS